MESLQAFLTGNDPETAVMRAAVASTAAAAIVMLVVGRFLARNTLGWLLGVAAGFVAGVAALQIRVSWPPVEVLGRFLMIVATAAFVIELLALRIGRWAWLPRIALAAAIVPVLLHGSIVTSDAAGPGTRQWSPLETVEYGVLFAEAIVAGWFSLYFLQERTEGRALPVALAIACGGGGVAVMYSHYLTGGQLGVALGGSLVGAAIASLLVTGPQQARGGLGLAWVGFVSVLIAGRYFGSLSTMHALLLFAAPFASWLPEILPTKVWIRGALGVALTAAQVGHVAWQTHIGATPTQEAAPANEADWYK